MKHHCCNHLITLTNNIEYKDIPQLVCRIHAHTHAICDRPFTFAPNQIWSSLIFPLVTIYVQLTPCMQAQNDVKWALINWWAHLFNSIDQIVCVLQKAGKNESVHKCRRSTRKTRKPWLNYFLSALESSWSVSRIQSRI